MFHVAHIMFALSDQIYVFVFQSTQKRNLFFEIVNNYATETYMQC